MQTTHSHVMPLSRRRFLQFGIYSLAALGAGACWRGAHGARDAFGILGQQAPPLSASRWIDAQGKPTTFAMEEIAGRWAFVECFQAWCPACQEHGLPGTAKIAEAFRDEPRVSVLVMQTVFEGFAFNSSEELVRVQREYGLPIKIGHDAGEPNGDPQPATMRRYRTGGTPWAIVIDPTGIVVFNDYHINVEGFIGYVRARLA